MKKISATQLGDLNRKISKAVKDSLKPDGCHLEALRLLKEREALTEPLPFLFKKKKHK